MTVYRLIGTVNEFVARFVRFEETLEVVAANDADASAITIFFFDRRWQAKVPLFRARRDLGPCLVEFIN